MLVVIVAVFLAYNANNGLPFVSTYNLKARVPNADALVKGNDIRIGGTLVGTVKSVKPVQLSDGRTAAELSLSLDKSAEPLPVDSTIMIRPKSALGLKFLQITPGKSSKGFAAGETIPLTAAKPEPVDIDQFFSMFNRPTRDAIRQSQAGFGDALAGRGPQLNEAFGELRNLVINAGAPLRTLVAPSTNFGGFWRALENLSATVAPVAQTQAEMFAALDATFGAFANVSRPYIQETISKSPPTLDAANEDLPVLRPFLHDSARFFTALKPGAKALGETSPVIAASLRAGIPVLNASPVLNNQLAPTAQALVDFGNAPGVFNGLELLTDTNTTLNPALRFITPAQTDCSYFSLVFRNLALSTGGGNQYGHWLNAFTFAPPSEESNPVTGQPGHVLGPNSEGTPSSAPANGPDRKNHLHYNPFPNTGAPGQPTSCEAGNEKFVKGQTIIGPAPEVWGTKTTKAAEE
ncbi:MAG TPA: MlaD family protein [Chloroflexota bacterium]|nr:MlaD family protein [Chloroflexota bacterium]